MSEPNERGFFMAWVDQGYWLTITSVDHAGKKTRVRYQMTAADEVTALADALLVLNRYEAITNSGTVSYTVTKQFANDALVLPAGQESQVEMRAVLIGRDETNPIKKHRITVPSPDPSIFEALNGARADFVDLGDANVIAFYGSFTTGGELLISDGEICQDQGDGGLLDGKRTHRRSSLG